MCVGHLSCRSRYCVWPTTHLSLPSTLPTPSTFKATLPFSTLLVSTHIHIHPFPMLVATGSFSPKRGLPVKFCVDFNHFKSIVMSALLHSKTLKCLFLNNFRLLFQMLPTNILFSRVIFMNLSFEND